MTLYVIDFAYICHSNAIKKSIIMKINKGYVVIQTTKGENTRSELVTAKHKPSDQKKRHIQKKAYETEKSIHSRIDYNNYKEKRRINQLNERKAKRK